MNTEHIVYIPTSKHHCEPTGQDHMWSPEGSVYECPADGKTWVAVYQKPTDPGRTRIFCVWYWRRERWWEKRRRLKRQRSSH
jgi:hypothetical protein